MNREFDVVVVGELNVDLILNRIEKMPAVGKEVISNDMTLTIGSSSAIFSCNLSTLGSKVKFVGRLGCDNFGDFVLNSLTSKGVNVDGIRRSATHLTGITTVLNFDEDRAMVTYPGAMKDLTLRDISDEDLQRSRHLHLSSVFLQTGLLSDITRLFKRAKTLGLTTSLDPQWDPTEKWDIDLQSLLPYVDVFMPNVEELLHLSRKPDLKKAIGAVSKLGTTLVVKKGSEGAYLVNKDETIFQEAFRNTNVADSIGAGDSFNAGFIHKFLLDRPWKECLEFGALMGAVNTTRPGGTSAFGDRQMIQSIAKSSFNYSF